MTHDAYQRGNRDGLLSFANQLDQRAEVAQEEAERYEAQLNKGRFATSPMHRGVVTRMHMTAHEIRTIAELARRAAEALPLDPEAPEED